MKKVAQYWRLAFLPLALFSLWTARVCVTQFEPVRRAIVMGTVLAILLIVAVVLMHQARGYAGPSGYRDVLARTHDYLASYRDVVWAPRLEAWLAELDRVKTNADLRSHAERSRRCSAGMGSLGDLSICPQNRHDIRDDRQAISAASKGLWSLTHELYGEADRLVRELSAGNER
jgi:hypothetical protein